MLPKLDRVWLLRMEVVVTSLWMFSLGYVTAIGFTRGLGWSTYQVTLFFPEGGMTGDQFVALFDLMRWVAIGLTFLMVVVCGLLAIQHNQEECEDVTDA